MTKLMHQIYNPSALSKEKLIKSFVVRLKMFQSIWEDIKHAEMKTPEQSILIEGQRGMGKTTLLLRLGYELENDKGLNTWLLPVVFNEEEYGIDRLFKLWLRVAKILEDNYPSLFSGLFAEMDDLYPETFPEGRSRGEEKYEKQIFEILEKKLLSTGKKIILFIDNLGTLLGKFQAHDLRRLRGVLMTCPEIRIIGATVGLSEEFLGYKAPFYEFFMLKRLRGLDKTESENLLIMLGDELTPNPIPEILQKYPAHVETLRRLTGGVTRTLVMLFEFLASEKITTAFQDLEKILDRTTPLYKHRMDDLPQQQQTIVQAIAMAWDGIAVKEIITETRLESKTISAQLSSLVEAGIVEATKPPKTKNQLYQLSERFFNIWYLMRFGNKNDRKKVLWLTKFYEAILDKNMLKERIEKMKNDLQQAEGKDCDSHYKYALALSEVNLVSEQDRLEIYLTAKHHFERLGSLDLAVKIDELIAENYKKNEFKVILHIEGIGHNNPKPFDNEDEIALDNIHFEPDFKVTIFGEEFIERLAKKQQTEKEVIINVNLDRIAQRLMQKIEAGEMKYASKLGDLYFSTHNYALAEKYFLLVEDTSNIDVLFYLGNACFYQEKYKDAEKYYLLAIEKGQTDALNNLAVLHDNQAKYEAAEKYYLLAIKKGNINALHNLAILYHNQGKQADAEKHYLLSIEKEDINALFNLAILYQNQGKQADAEKYFLLAVEKGNVDALYNLALLYDYQGKQADAEKYYLLAIEKGHIDALNNLAVLYSSMKKYDEAEKYYLLAVEKGNVDALYNLAIIYNNHHRYEEAEKYFLLAVEKGNLGALNNLGALYYSQNNYIEAEKYYLSSIENGGINAIYNLAILYTNQNKYVEAEKYYLLTIEKGGVYGFYNLALLYENQKKYIEAEKYYLLAIENGEVNATYNLALLYENQKKSIEAEKYYLLAIEKGDVDALNNLALLYKNQGKIDNAEKYYLLAIEKGNVDAYNSLLWHYYANAEKEKASALLSKRITVNPENLHLNHTLSCVYAWLGEYEKSVEMAESGFLYNEENIQEESWYIEYFLRLLTKGQYEAAYRLFTNEKATKLQFKDRFKPLYYTVLYYLQEQYATEYLRMGSDLQETVLELVARVTEMKKKYE